MPPDALRLIASPRNRAILSLLAAEPAHPRRVAGLLSMPESDAARRLRAMEKAGLVEGAWRRLDTNVRTYRLCANTASLVFGPDGVTILMGGTKRSAEASQIEAPPPDLPRVFVGRHDELSALGASSGPVVVEGIAGIGKSSLVASYARQQRDKRPVFWHRVRTVDSEAWLMSRLALHLAAAGVKPALFEADDSNDERPRLERAMDLIERAGSLLVFDDAQNARDSGLRGLLRTLCERVDDAQVVAISRTRLSWLPARVRRLRLRGLDAEAVSTFAGKKGLPIPERLERRVRKEVGGHPLALNILLETAGNPEKLDTLLDGLPEEPLTDYLLSELYDVVSESERRVLAALSVFPGPFSPEEADVVVSRRDESAFLSLRRRLLVDETLSGFELHEVVRNFFRSVDRSSKSRHLALADHYLATATIEGRLEAMRHLMEAGGEARVLSMLERDLDLEEAEALPAAYQTAYDEVLEALARTKRLTARQAALVDDERGDLRFTRKDYDGALRSYQRAARVFNRARDLERVADLTWKIALSLERMGNAERAGSILAAFGDGNGLGRRATARLRALRDRLTAAR
ncbi:MAG: helix-turn-helix domain-containing protein [Euryarchaeota archaeon]|nr:helix-turn-helix domain-containing protein [Euryarchaeota archaeon]